MKNVTLSLKVDKKSLSHDSLGFSIQNSGMTTKSCLDITIVTAIICLAIFLNAKKENVKTSQKVDESSSYHDSLLRFQK